MAFEVLGIFDMFGAAPTIKRKGQDKTYSYCGLIIPISAICLIILLLVSFSGDMMNKTNPIYSQTTVYGSLGDKDVIWNKNTFTMAFGVMDNDSEEFYTDDRIDDIIH